MHGPYPLARHLYLRRLSARAAVAPSQVVIYQMGKVGSSTVRRSIHHAAPEVLVHHVHTLTDEGMSRLDVLFRASWPKGNARHLWSSQYLRHEMDGPTPRRPWKIITLVREPIARNVSSFFEVGALEFGCDFSTPVPTADEAGLARELQTTFLDVFDQHDRPLTWFEREFHPVTGCDVFGLPSPRDRGWCRFQHGQFDVLILRLEDVDRVGEEALGDFLGVQGFQLVTDNETATKPYAPAYGALLRHIDLPREYTDRMYGSGYARHFYTQDEREAFAARWHR